MSQGEQFDCSSTSDCEGVNSEAANLTGEMWSNPKKSPRRNVTHRRPKQEEPGSSKTDSSRTSSTESDLVEAPIKTVKVDGAEYILVGGPCASFHGHYDRDDGMGTVDSLAQTAVEARVPFWAVT
ncbi:MAG: hypothetical protein K2X29_10145, partial [Candidatus Obscuribacterales bacterium]|nr:hypothetical protein [Candidatus Obscuribacterales bacterium]